mmetsp:Transcript_13941/g.37034  ORF Transcript_13941/g.37034 Transcript_13941/m.37034 type:complete len:222 (-) Transcript_13941:3-668(-)
MHCSSLCDQRQHEMSADARAIASVACTHRFCTSSICAFTRMPVPIWLQICCCRSVMLSSLSSPSSFDWYICQYSSATFRRCGRVSSAHTRRASASSAPAPPSASSSLSTVSTITLVSPGVTSSICFMEGHVARPLITAKVDTGVSGASADGLSCSLRCCMSIIAICAVCICRRCASGSCASICSRCSTLMLDIACIICAIAACCCSMAAAVSSASSRPGPE